MLRYELTAADLGATRFVISPLSEMARSLRALKAPAQFPLQKSWISYAKTASRNVDMRLLVSLVSDRLWTPDFLTPVTAHSQARIADELEQLGALDAGEFARQLTRSHGSMPRELSGDPGRIVERVSAALFAYWTATFGPSWVWMRRVLEADVEYRGRETTRRGLLPALNAISPAVRCSSDAIDVLSPIERVEPLNGQGVAFMPSTFSRRASTQAEAGSTPLVIYAVRGQGAMWEGFDPASGGAAIKILGSRRTQIIEILGSPASSTQLAARLGVSISAVNQQLRALQKARLLSSIRHGRSVLYTRTELAEALIRGEPTT